MKGIIKMKHIFLTIIIQETPTELGSIAIEVDPESTMLKAYLDKVMDVIRYKLEKIIKERTN